MLIDAAGNSATAPTVTGAIRSAAQATGASFEYLLATAQVESGLNPNATASTSSAGGLYQFIDQTWLGMLKEAGPSLGYGRYADAITKSSSGAYEVSDPSLRSQMLALRHDPTASSAMAGAFTQRNADALGAQLGRKPSEGELYIAHFLGPAGAAKLIQASQQSPQANAAALFPSAAGANRSIFYDKQGQPRSAGEVYASLVHRFDTARNAVADAGFTVPPRPTVGLPGTVATAQNDAQLGPPTTSSVPSAVPSSGFDAAAFAAQQTASTGPVFHSLFRSDEHPQEHRGAVSPVVQELWGAGNKPATDASTVSTVSNTTPSLKTAGLRDLYSDQPADVRALFGNTS